MVENVTVINNFRLHLQNNIFFTTFTNLVKIADMVECDP